MSLPPFRLSIAFALAACGLAAHASQMIAWRSQALASIEDRDRREQAVASRPTSQQIIAELWRRAQTTTAPGREVLAAGEAGH